MIKKIISLINNLKCRLKLTCCCQSDCNLNDSSSPCPSPTSESGRV